MPRGDRTGPNGDGPMTGRSMGYCAENDRPGFAETGYGRGRGFGRRNRRGFGRGFGRYYSDTYYDNGPAVSEKTILENDIRILKDQLSSLEERLDEAKNEK